MRRVCCLVSHPRHRACRPGLLWPRCAAGSDVCPRSAEELYPLTWNKNYVLEFFIIIKRRHIGFPFSFFAYRERIWDGVLLCCLKSHSFNWPMEFTVKISVVLRYVTAWIVLLSAFSRNDYTVQSHMLLTPWIHSQVYHMLKNDNTVCIPMILVIPSWSALKTMILPSSPTVTISGLLHTTPVQGALSQG